MDNRERALTPNIGTKCECICGCEVVAMRPDTIPYLCSVCSIREMRGDGEFHHLKRGSKLPTPIASLPLNERIVELAKALATGWEHRDETAQFKADMSLTAHTLLEYIDERDATVGEARAAIEGGPRPEWGVKHGIQEHRITSIEDIFKMLRPGDDEDSIFLRDSAKAFYDELAEKMMSQAEWICVICNATNDRAKCWQCSHIQNTAAADGGFNGRTERVLEAAPLPCIACGKPTILGEHGVRGQSVRYSSQILETPARLVVSEGDDEEANPWPFSTFSVSPMAARLRSEIAALAAPHPVSEGRLREALERIIERFEHEDKGGLTTRAGLAWAMYSDAKAALESA